MTSYRRANPPLVPIGRAGIASATGTGSPWLRWLFLSQMQMPPLQRLCVPRPTSSRGFTHEHVNFGQPLPLPLDELRLGRQSAREAVYPVDLGAVVSHTTEEDEQHFRENQLPWLMRLLLAWMAFSSTGLALAAVPDTQSAASLHAKYVSLGERLQRNPFKRALTLDSSESPNDLKGDIYALVDYPFSAVSAALNGPDQWCDVLILHINRLCHC